MPASMLGFLVIILFSALLYIGSLLIYVERLFDFVSVSKYGSSFGGRSTHPLSSDRLEFVYD